MLGLRGVRGTRVARVARVTCVACTPQGASEGPAPFIRKKKGVFAKQAVRGNIFQRRAALRAMRQHREEKGDVSYVPPEWLADHIFKLPADARAQHDRAVAAPSLSDHPVCWADLRRVQVNACRMGSGLGSHSAHSLLLTYLFCGQAFYRVPNNSACLLTHLLTCGAGH